MPNWKYKVEVNNKSQIDIYEPELKYSDGCKEHFSQAGNFPNIRLVLLF